MGFGLALVAITFSMRKGEKLAWQASSKDSVTMDVKKSTHSPSESDSNGVRFDFFFFFEDAMCAICSLLALFSTTYHGVRVVLRMYQGGNSFPLVEKGIHDKYT